MESSYLRGTQVGFTVSFSRSSAPIVIQYYLFLHYGRQTFCNRTRSLLLHAGELACRLEQTGFFQCLSPICRHQDEAQDYLSRGSRDEWPTIHRTDKGACHSSCMCSRSYDGIPIVVFTWSAAVKQESPWVRLGTLSDMMYARGFSIPGISSPRKIHMCPWTDFRISLLVKELGSETRECRSASHCSSQRHSSRNRPGLQCHVGMP